jgi:hypothetical protein
MEPVVVEVAESVADYFDYFDIRLITSVDPLEILPVVKWASSSLCGQCPLVLLFSTSYGAPAKAIVAPCATGSDDEELGGG